MRARSPQKGIGQTFAVRRRERALPGFTLIEVLVILAIISILMAILAPVFAQAREQIRSYKCLSNLRQVGMATTFYLQDYDEQFPCVRGEENQWIPDIHEAYVKQWGVWVCPSDSHARFWDGVWNSPSFQRRTSYVWNAYAFQGDASDWTRSIMQSSVQFPATFVLWTEGYANPGWTNDGAPLSDPELFDAVIHNAYGDNLNTTELDPSAAACPTRHNEHLDVIHHKGGNYVFADGHARWLRPSAFTTADIVRNGGQPVDDPSDPMVTNGARHSAQYILCPVFCCPGPMGTPPPDGERPWFRY